MMMAHYAFEIGLLNINLNIAKKLFRNLVYERRRVVNFSENYIVFLERVT